MAAYWLAKLLELRRTVLLGQRRSRFGLDELYG